MFSYIVLCHFPFAVSSLARKDEAKQRLLIALIPTDVSNYPFLEPFPMYFIILLWKSRYEAHKYFALLGLYFPWRMTKRHNIYTNPLQWYQFSPDYYGWRSFSCEENFWKTITIEDLECLKLMALSWIWHRNLHERLQAFLRFWSCILELIIWQRASNLENLIFCNLEFCPLQKTLWMMLTCVDGK